MEAKDIVTKLKSLGLTQTQIAEGTGIPQPTISKIERGAIDDVLSKSYRALLAFCEKQDRIAQRAKRNTKKPETVGV